MKNYKFMKKLLVLALVLIASSPQMWAGYNWYGNVFFRAPDDWGDLTGKHVQLGLAQGTSTTNTVYVYFLTEMTRVGTTRLYYTYTGVDHSSWGKEYVVFTMNTSNWNSNNIKLNSCSGWTTPVDYGFSNSDNPYLFNPSGNSNGATVSGSNSSTGSSYSDKRDNLLKKTQRANLYTNGSSSKVGGSVQIDAYYLTGNTSVATSYVTNGSNTYASYDAAIGTQVTLTASESTGYDFDGWYTEATGGSLVSSSNPYSYTCTGATTVYARFKSETYNGTINANGGDENTSYTATYKSKSLVITVPTKTGYHITGYYTNAACTTKIANANKTLVASTAYTNSSKEWTYTSSAPTLFAGWDINTYTIAFNANDATYAGPEATGTTASIAATYGVSYSLTANGFSKEGYTFNGWNSQAGGGGTNYTDGQTVSNLTTTHGATVTLYAKWTGHTYTVTFNPMGGSNLNHHDATVTMGALYTAGTGLGGALPTVTAPTGYVFAGWYTAAKGGDKIDESSKVATPNDHTLYAHYVKKAQVYFKNTLGWTNVYVTYDAEWNHGDQDRGAGSSGKTQHQMTQIAGTNIYYDDIPDAVLSSWKYNIAFTSEGMSNYDWFSRGNAVFRRDFDSDATMFVPTPDDEHKFIKNNISGNPGTWYYSTDQYVDKEGGKITNYRYKNGYWIRYNDLYAGYSLKGSWAWTVDHYVAKPTMADNTYVYTMQDLPANTDYYFRLYKHCETSNTYSSQFATGDIITSSNCTNVELSAALTTGDVHMKTTVAGDYTFKFTFGDDGVVKMNLVYPFYVNDYKVVYSYTKGSAQTFESEIIKGRANGIDTISMFIHSGDSATSRALTIYKCTGINASGVATWNTSYGTITIPSETAHASGVYNFIITQDGSAAASGALWKKHDGNYYIRTYVSDGGWDLYKYREDNVMKLSEYSMTQTLSAPYSHYYCRYVESTSADITYTVATDYSPKICPIMIGDATIGDGNRTLPSGNPANIRFSWNEETNSTRRAYLKSAQGSGNARYLVLHGSDSKLRNADGTTIPKKGDGAEDMKANELLFTDIGNWVYQVDLKAQPGAAASLIARYNSVDRYLIGGESSHMTLLGGSGVTAYPIKAVYDFKTNRLMTAWTPSGDITENLTNVDVLLIRHQQNSGTIITFSGGSLSTQEIIGAIELRYNELVGQVSASSWNQAMREKLKYFISFPFDVNVSDIFGLNSAYGDAYVIQRYAGDERASKGFFRGDGTTTFWKDMAPGDVMKANEGYCVILDNDYFNGDMGNIWDNKAAGSSVYLYFPSDGNVGAISADSKTISIPEHECTIERTFTSTSAGGREVSHKNTDSHWNMMGVPVFADHSDNGVSGEPGGVFADSYGDDADFNYFFEWSPSTNQFSVRSAKNYPFRSMHSYMVQYHGDVTFVGSHPGTPASVAAHKAPQKENYQIELQVLNSDADVLNRAYVELRENACDTFALNEDVYMSYNSRPVNIYTLAGNYDVAANVLSINDHTIPVGLEVTKAGTYRISMPSNFSGEVMLLDTFTGESTNLTLEDFEVTLPKGVIVDRFFLKINIKKVATAIDGVEDGSGSLKDGKAHKFIENGQMYILQNGLIYDAQGKRVK